MQLPTVLVLSIAAATGLVGVLFLFIPGRIGRLETWLNAPWGDREMASLRLGLRAEQAIEQRLNRDVLSRQIVWDNWLQQYPRLVGAALCLFACWLVAQT